MTELGISMLVNDEQSLKALPPIDVTEFGISILFKDEQLLKT